LIEKIYSQLKTVKTVINNGYLFANPRLKSWVTKRHS